MVKSVKSSTEVSAKSAAPVAAATPAAAAPKKESKPKAAAAAPAAATATPAAAAPVASSASSTEGGDAASATSSLFTNVLQKIQSLQSVISALRTEVRELERQHARDLRTANKANKRRKPAANRAPSGFVKPTLISNELAQFLGKPNGSVLARTEVTREVNAYIREKGLQDKENGRKINPDTKLASLLKLKKGEELTYFNLQKYMSIHFAKSVKAPAAASS